MTCRMKCVSRRRIARSRVPSAAGKADSGGEEQHADSRADPLWKRGLVVPGAGCRLAEILGGSGHNLPAAPLVHDARTLVCRVREPRTFRQVDHERIGAVEPGIELDLGPPVSVDGDKLDVTIVFGP